MESLIAFKLSVASDNGPTMPQVTPEPTVTISSEVPMTLTIKVIIEVVLYNNKNTSGNELEIFIKVTFELVLYNNNTGGNELEIFIKGTFELILYIITIQVAMELEIIIIQVTLELVLYIIIIIQVAMKLLLIIQMIMKAIIMTQLQCNGY